MEKVKVYRMDKIFYLKDMYFTDRYVNLETFAVYDKKGNDNFEFYAEETIDKLSYYIKSSKGQYGGRIVTINSGTGLYLTLNDDNYDLYSFDLKRVISGYPEGVMFEVKDFYSGIYFGARAIRDIVRNRYNTDKWLSIFSNAIGLDKDDLINQCSDFFGDLKVGDFFWHNGKKKVVLANSVLSVTDLKTESWLNTNEPVIKIEDEKWEWV